MLVLPWCTTGIYVSSIYMLDNVCQVASLGMFAYLRCYQCEAESHTCFENAEEEPYGYSAFEVMDRGKAC